MKERNRTEHVLVNNSNHVVAEREGARIGATSIAAQIASVVLPGGGVPRRAVVEDGAKQVYHPDCVLDLTLDFAAWCPSCVAPDGSFDPARRCAYCYAAGNKLHFPKTRIVDPAKLAAQLARQIRRLAAMGLSTRCLRLGKKMDAGHPLFRPQLAATLRACAEIGLPVVIPTKYLTYDVEIAALMIEARAIFMPSLGADVLEPGALLWGMTQEARIEAGLRYQAAGVLTAPFVLLDPTREFGGDLFRPVVGAALRLFDRVQLLPIRLRSKVLVQQVLGDWDELVAPGPTGEPPKFEAAKNDTRIPLVYHPSIIALIGDNTGSVRMCAHNSMQSHCGACFVSGEVGSVTTAEQPPMIAPLVKATPDRIAAVNTAGLVKFAGSRRSS